MNDAKLAITLLASYAVGDNAQDAGHKLCKSFRQ